MSSVTAPINPPQRRGPGAPRGNRNAARPTFIGQLLAEIKFDKGRRLKGACNKLLDAAAEGNLEAIKFLAEKLDGRAPQSIAITGEDGGPVQIHARPMITAEEWLRVFAPGVTQVIEGEAVPALPERAE